MSLSESSGCEASAADSLVQEQPSAIPGAFCQADGAVTSYSKNARTSGQRKTSSEETGTVRSFSVFYLTATLNTHDSLYMYRRIYYTSVFFPLTFTKKSKLLFKYFKIFDKSYLKSIHLNVL